MLILLSTSTSSALCKTFGRGCTTRLILTFSHGTNLHYSTIIEHVSPLLNLLKEQCGASGIITKTPIPNISNRPLKRKRRRRLNLHDDFKLQRVIKQGTSSFREGVDGFRRVGKAYVLDQSTDNDQSSATMGGRHSSARSQAPVSIENAQISPIRGPSAVSMNKTWQQVTNDRQQQQFEQAWKVGTERAAHLGRESLARDETLSSVVSTNLTPILTLGTILRATDLQRDFDVPFSCGADLATATSTLRIVEDAVPNAMSGDGRQMLNVATQDNSGSDDGTNMITKENPQESSPSPSITSEESDSDTPSSTELANDVKTRLLEQLMAVFLKRYHVILNRLLSDDKVRRHQDGGKSTDNGAAESTQATDRNTATDNAATREHKRPRNDDQDDDGRSGGSGRKRSNVPRVRNTEEAADKLACPFSSADRKSTNLLSLAQVQAGTPYID